jgi:porin
LKIGGWHHLGQFNDQRWADNGMLLADPASGGVPAQRRGDSGIYGVIDQQLYRLPGGAPDSGVSVFTRASVSPSDRNLVSFQIDGGFVFAGLIPQRPNDRFGVSVLYSRFSSGVRAFDQDQINFGTGPDYVRDYETNIEFTYLAQIIPGWTVQPVFTYIRHPNGEPGRDAKVTGLRSIWKF